ncbi:MAG: hypothetical protein O3C25_02355 [Chloroflexi bacterium]|nr:hypothetical protein [Chloroflexota bacterium]
MRESYTRRMPWSDPDDPRPSSWRDVLDLALGSYGILLGFLLFAFGGFALIALAVVLFAWHSVAGFAYLGLGVAVVIAIWIRDRRRNPIVR